MAATVKVKDPSWISGSPQWPPLFWPKRMWWTQIGPHGPLLPVCLPWGRLACGFSGPWQLGDEKEVKEHIVLLSLWAKANHLGQELTGLLGSQQQNVDKLILVLKVHKLVHNVQAFT